MNVKSMETAATDVSNILKLLSNPNRLLILCQLVDGEKSVGELARLIGASQVTVSQQLGLLKNTGILTSRRDAQTIYYSLERKEIRQLIHFLYDTFCPLKEQPKPRRVRRTA
ncbi:MAG: metalloregulator ArsR/SmtB family transcription factor [Arenicellales bacterium]|nr:metalloregulator ArsR/SmtB family transcription factor [Arenicellales bacterium]